MACHCKDIPEVANLWVAVYDLTAGLKVYKSNPSIGASS
jgi:hypothetical protein